ncbi:MAG: hypothetical protein ABSA06_02320 [Geobacteraceae bacterium]
MISYYRFFLMVAFTPLICGIFGAPVFAGEASQDGSVMTESSPAAETDDRSTSEGAGVEDTQGMSRADTHTLAEGFAGYRFLDVDRFGGRADEYDYLHSGPSLGGSINRLGDDLKFSLDGNYLNEKDYSGDLMTDYRGEYRFSLHTESLFHNLDHEQLGPDFVLGTNYQTRDQDPGGVYGVRVEQDQAAFRYKLHNYPLHINLGYWRLLRDGTSQLRFSDTMFEYSGTNAVNAVARRINQETHEGNFGIDAHLGFVDLVYNFQIREFGDNVATPVYSYVGRTPVDPTNPPLLPGSEQHNENPDSRYLAHTVKLHTSLDGGIVGAASYSYGIRENRSTLSDVQGANRGRDTLQNAAGDFIYIPCKEFTLALKVRHQEVDRDNPAMLFDLPAASTINVRPSLDTQRDTVTATVSIRATNTLTFKGEYKGDFLHRDNAQFWNAPLAQVTQNLPDNSTVHKGTVAVLSRPLKGLRLKAQYIYSATDNPSYGTSFGEKHEGELFASYNSPNRWGATADYRLTRESNDGIVDATFAHTVTTPPTTFISFDNPTFRNRDTDNATLSLWVSPFDRFTLSGSYGFLRARTGQGVLFADLATAPPAAFANTNYTTQAQIYSLTGVYNFNERLDFSLAWQQIFSFSVFSPDIIAFSPTSSTANIQGISQTRTVESSLSARAEYRLTKNFSCVLDYSYRDYDEKIQSLANGTVQTVSAYMRAKW